MPLFLSSSSFPLKWSIEQKHVYPLHGKSSDILTNTCWAPTLRLKNVPGAFIYVFYESRFYWPGFVHLWTKFFGKITKKRGTYYKRGSPFKGLKAGIFFWYSKMSFFRVYHIHFTYVRKHSDIWVPTKTLHWWSPRYFSQYKPQFFWKVTKLKY